MVQLVTTTFIFSKEPLFCWIDVIALGYPIDPARSIPLLHRCLLDSWFPESRK